ncbi:MAG: hypothetical protein U0Y68_25050 [Blastocatellia bacterium]
MIKEEELDLSRQPKDKVHSALHIYYDDLIHTLITGLGESLASASNLPKLDRPIPIVLSGGTAKPRGFMQKFEAAAKAGDFPVQISRNPVGQRPPGPPPHAAATSPRCQNRKERRKERKRENGSLGILSFSPSLFLSPLTFLPCPSCCSS